MQISLRLLGGAAVQVGGSETQLTLDRPLSLLVHLALRADWVSRAELALLYRPEASDAAASAYLRKLVFRARQHDWAAGLETSPGALRWLVATDVAEFLARVSAKDWAAALDLYGGPLLGSQQLDAAPGFASWLALERQVLRSRWLQAALSRAEAHATRSEFSAAAELLQRVVESDPLDEENVQACMRVLASDGRAHEALAVYERFRLELADELDDQPLETTQALADSLHEQAAVAARPATRLPEPTTSFVGRTRELSSIAELLQRPDVRLVTLVGLGGSGKTRLALEVARRSGEQWRDGAAFISLAGISSQDGLVQGIADGLGVMPVGRDPGEALQNALQTRELLLVLDDMDAALSSAPYLMTLLENAPGLTLLVTSREALRVSGEWLVDPGGLNTDDGGDSASDALQLFVQRAVRVSPQIVFSPEELVTVADMCRRLEGLPLAIELAASWLRLLSVSELAGQLQLDSAVLTTELRDVPERQRSVWRVMAHSWERLSAAEQSILTRLTVFRGSFSLEAARAVAGAELDLLLGLVERTLVRRRTSGRFALHALISQYARLHGPAADLAEARTAHMQFFTGLLGRVAADLKGRDVPAGLELVQQELAEVEAAWDHAAQQLDLSALASAREALEYFLYYRARFTTGSRLFGTAAAALAGAHGAEAQRLRGWMLLHQSDHERLNSRLQPARELLDEALGTLREWGSELDLAYAHLAEGTMLRQAGNYAAAEAKLQAVLEVAASAGDNYLAGSAHNGLGTVLADGRGDVERAEEHYRLSLAAHRRIDNLEGITGALVNLGACRFELDDLSEAERLWTEAAEACSLLGYRQREAAILNNLGSLAEERGDEDAAQLQYERSLKMRREIGDTAGIARVLPNLGRLAHRRHDHARARVLFQESLDVSLAAGESDAVVHSRSMLIRSLAGLGRFRDAAAQAQVALELTLDTDSLRDALSVLFSVALLWERQGQACAALRLAVSVGAAAAGTLEPLRREAELVAGRLAASCGRPAEPAPDIMQLAADVLEQLRQLPAGQGRGTPVERS